MPSPLTVLALLPERMSEPQNMMISFGVSDCENEIDCDHNRDKRDASDSFRD
jgi:hypothetical protein